MGDDIRQANAIERAEEALNGEESTAATHARKEGEDLIAQKDAKSSPAKSAKQSSAQRKKEKPKPNNVRKLRMERMMSKAELARRAGISTLTVDRVERGMNCRMDTRRKIIEALGLKPSDRKMVFPEDD